MEDTAGYGTKRFWARVTEAIRTSNTAVRIGLAELLGTCLLVIVGDGSIAQFVLCRGSLESFASVNFGYFVAVTLALYASCTVSGGHVNPAVTLAMCVLGRLRWSLLPVYWAAQYLGAFIGAAAVYGVYKDAIENFDGGNRSVDGVNATAGIFATYPRPYLTVGGGMSDQIVGAAVLVGCIMAITDKRNNDVPSYVTPILVGLTLLSIGLAFGFNCGYGINPARDLGPRIFTAIAGWGTSVFSVNSYQWFWIPIVGPHLGGIFGAVIYLLLIEAHWPPANQAAPIAGFENPLATAASGVATFTISGG